jgi:hypothetical protein
MGETKQTHPETTRSARNHPGNDGGNEIAQALQEKAPLGSGSAQAITWLLNGFARDFSSRRNFADIRKTSCPKVSDPYLDIPHQARPILNQLLFLFSGVGDFLACPRGVGFSPPAFLRKRTSGRLRMDALSKNLMKRAKSLWMRLILLRVQSPEIMPQRFNRD